MRSFYIALLVLLLGSTPVFGQVTIQVDSSTPMPAEDLSSVLIDDNGNMLITSVNGDYLLMKDSTPRGGVSINTFRINNLLTDKIENPGDSATISWSTTNAVSCVASNEVTQGTAPQLTGWSDATQIGVTGSLAVQFPDVGEFRLHIDCVDTIGNTATAQVTAKVGGVIIEKFTVSPTAAEAGTDVDLTFDWVAANADSCFGTWPDDVTLDLGSVGPDTVRVADIKPGAEYTLTCMNVLDEVSVTVTVDVTTPAPTCDVKLTSKLLKNWTTSFGSVFPGPNFTRVAFAAVPATGYTSYTFETGDAQDDGSVATFQANGTSGGRLIAISEVPGCFDVDAECMATGRDTTIDWDTTGTSSSACQLKADTRYYWNITFTDGADPQSTDCESDCYAGLVVVNSDF